MYIAMNRFKVRIGAEDAFEEIWKSRETHLPGMKGFKSFHLLRGPAEDAAGHTLYATHTVWECEEDFVAWTQSQGFRDSHGRSGSGPLLKEPHPRFEGFTAIGGA